MDIYVSVFLALICSLPDVRSLRNVQALIPQAAKLHDSLIFRCEFDLEGEPLYTVKWYKGPMEFFRYVPNEDPKMQIFPVSNIQVDLSRSSLNEIVLLDVEQEATGRYKCEVSTDAPNFYTTASSAFLYVVDVPEEDPIMDINKDQSGHTNVIRANCTTPPSYPAMNVTWYINGIKVKETGRKSVSLDPLYAYSKNRRSPYMTISYLEKEIDENIFQSGAIKVQCISTLFNLYKSENVRYIDDVRPQPWPSSVIGSTAANTTGSLIVKTTWACIITTFALIFIQ
ncbi:uncharacterized protein LOC109533651 isoform X1 [Dendroctonus ponderosae]|uniref:uncharacterized protein LOC109533651 isoform X1 n=1 Tax=Dendroctonus ponderosae TaxID=77166 RepID=UPI002035B3B6|nr:uncharacterized protein LOC109533651 isoform X1 [Dendroctonus ponderosae]